MTNETGTNILKFNARGEERKRLVKAIAEFRQTFSEYTGAPHFFYLVDELQIDRDGVVTFLEPTDAESVQELVAYLESKGFRQIGQEPEDAEKSAEPPAEDAAEGSEEEEAAEPAESPSAEFTGFTVELPKEGFTELALEHLQKLVDSKASLLKKAIGTDALPIEITDDRIRFPWFPDAEDPLAVQTYTHLIAALGEMAKKAKRVTGTDHPVESEKYAFRIWLLRLGFNGAEFKHERALLMKNLSGTAAFRNQEEADAFAEKQKAKREAKKAAERTAAEATPETTALTVL